jgi:predicted nucleic acid-binding protein
VAAYFVDTSALAKRYVRETGSVWLRGVLDPATGAETFIVRITAVEMIAALTRRERGGSLLPADATAARSAFRRDLAVEYRVIELTPALGQRAMDLAEAHGLRAYDAVQLAAALEVNDRLLLRALPPLTFLYSDTELNTAAVAEGLTTDDPNLHP